MDLRVEKTYRSLKIEFMRLLEQKNFEDISVAELCDGAMIRRTTFYKHFADKNEFLTFFVKEMRDEFAARTRIEGYDATDPAENSQRMLEQTLAFLSEHGTLVDNALSSRSAPLIIDALGDVIQADTLRLLKNRAESKAADGASEAAEAGEDDKPVSLSESDPEMFATFWSGGIVKMLRAWCEAGRPPEMKQRMADMVQAARAML